MNTKKRRLKSLFLLEVYTVFKKNKINIKTVY